MYEYSYSYLLPKHVSRVSRAGYGRLDTDWTPADSRLQKLCTPGSSATVRVRVGMVNGDIPPTSACMSVLVHNHTGAPPAS
eukprot:scaffold178374_cov20-Prasinocladus_malaysianus.AAC.1